MIQQDPALWQKAIDTAEPVVDWVLTQYSRREDLTTAIGKRKFTSAALRVVRALQDPVEQEHYLQKVSTYTQSSIETLKEKLSNTDEPEEKELKKVIKALDDLDLQAPGVKENDLVRRRLMRRCRHIEKKVGVLLGRKMFERKK